MSHNSSWWKTTTIYQIYPRSFNDSNGDGIGDIPGIIAKLDYIRDLGFETIWVSPFFASPQRDWAYDVSGYREIAPEYGTLSDAEQLIKEVHQRGMKVLFDLVLNHTSDQHPWFIESSSSKKNPKSDWYIWRNGKGPNRPPTNWKALPGGSGWHYHPGRDQWYYASFLPFQPDLNWRNPAVKQEMFQIAKFWLDKGVDGFRLDIFHVIFKDAEFRDNPFHWSYLPKDDYVGFFTEWKYTINQPETVKLAEELRLVLDKFTPERIMLGEIFGEDSQIKKYLGDGRNRMQLMFLWDLMDFKFSAEFFWNVLDKFENTYPQPYTPVLVLGNHDSKRWVDRVGGDIQKAKLLVLLQLTARGVPVVYYGEEIGLPEGQLPAQKSLDPIGQRYAWVPNWLLKALNLYVNRDNCRTPMAWDSSVHAGFTEPNAKPWLPLSAPPERANAADEDQDPNSILSWYKSLLRLKREFPAINNASLKLYPPEIARKGILGYSRQYKGWNFIVLINFGTKPVVIPLNTIAELLKTGNVQTTSGKIKLGKYSGGVFTVSPI